MSRPKWRKLIKVRVTAPKYAIYKDVVVVVKRGCALIIGQRLRVFGLEYELRWYLLIGKSLKRFFKSAQKGLIF